MELTMEKKKRGLRLLDPMRDGPGVEKGEDTAPTLRYFFKLFGRKFWKLVSLNLIMLVQVIPLGVCLFAFFSGPTTPTQYFPLYAPLLGAQTAAPTTFGQTLLNLSSGLFSISTYNTPIYWIIGAMALFQLVTYGWQKAGTIYILRSLVRGDGVFLISDYFYGIRKNLRQGFLLGLIDCIVLFALGFDFYYFYSMPPSLINNVMYGVIVALVVLWGIMRFYTYLMMVTFDMKISKILKNALIFTALGVKRNLMALLGIALLTALFGAFVVVCLTVWTVLIPLAIILPVLCYLAFVGFAYTYAAWPVIKRYMIDPVPAKKTGGES